MPKLVTAFPVRALRAKRSGIPRSPFQKLIDTARIGLGLSLRDLAAKVPHCNHNSLHIWLTNANGYPHPKSFKLHHLRGLAHALGIKESEIEEALDRSRRIYTPIGLDPMPPNQIALFESLIEVLEHDTRTYIPRATVLNLAKRLYAGSQAPLVPMPAPRPRKRASRSQDARCVAPFK